MQQQRPAHGSRRPSGRHAGGSSLQVTSRLRRWRRGAARGQEEEDKVGWDSRVLVAGRPWSSTPCPWWPLGLESGERRWVVEGVGRRVREAGCPFKRVQRRWDTRWHGAGRWGASSAMVATSTDTQRPLRHSTEHVAGDGMTDVGSRFGPLPG